VVGGVDIDGINAIINGIDGFPIKITDRPRQMGCRWVSHSFGL
jgi:hypothetical protein